MDTKKEWAAIAAAVATVVTALLGSLAGLGDHGPGVVAGLLIASPIVYLYVSREQHITTDRDRCRECMAEHEREYKDMVTRLMTLADTSNAAMNAVNMNMAAMSRNTQVSEKLDALEARIRDTGVRKYGDEARRSGQARNETG